MQTQMADWERLVGLIELADLNEEDLAETIRRVAGGCLGPSSLNWRQSSQLSERLQAARHQAFDLMERSSWFINNEWPPVSGTCPNYHQPDPAILTFQHWLSSARRY